MEDLRRLATVPQVVVGFVQPILAGGIEHIQVNRVFKGPSLVRHVGRDAKHFSGFDDDLPAIDGKLERAFHNVRHLFIVMVMERDMRALFHDYAGKHQVLAGEHLALDERVERFALDSIPGNVFCLGWAGHFLSP